MLVSSLQNIIFQAPRGEQSDRLISGQVHVWKVKDEYVADYCKEEKSLDIPYSLIVGL